MGRLIALDYGTKRVGVAETDDLQLIASPLTTVHSSEIVAFLMKYCEQHEVEVIVVGEPKTLDNQATDSTKVINEFVVHIQKKIPGVKLVRVDERFTSKMASQALIAGGMSKKKRREKGALDAVSAAIILQSYMESL